MKITGGGEDLEGVFGGECNDFVGDCGNYEDIPDVQMVGISTLVNGCRTKFQ